MKKFGLKVGACLLALTPAWATDLVYTPVNPSFGGAPLNGSTLLGIANATNKYYKEPEKSAIERFNTSLQSAILSKLSSQILSNMFAGASGFNPGTYETGNYVVTITDLGNGQISIETTEKSSGETASFTVSSAIQ
jgi:curli production assembly/transport component CsgF